MSKFAWVGFPNKWLKLFRQILKKLFKLIDHNVSGEVTLDQVMDFTSSLTNPRLVLLSLHLSVVACNDFQHFSGDSTYRSVDQLTPEDLERFTALFRQFGTGNKILKEHFKKILQTKNV